MSLYLFDILQFSFFIISAYCAWRFYKSRKYLWLVPMSLVFMFFVFSPVNFTVKNASKRFYTSHSVVEKVEVKRESFNEKQYKKLSKLKEQSEEFRNEEID